MSTFKPQRHRESRPALERFLDRIDKDSTPPHWLWMGRPAQSGYGVLNLSTEGNGRRVLVHRFAWEQFNGPIPEGMDIGHACHDKDPACPGGHQCWHRLCCNPFGCLVLQTRYDNLKGSPNTNSGKTHCKHGHEFTPENTTFLSRGERVCRTCKKIRNEELKARKTMKRLSQF